MIRLRCSVFGRGSSLCPPSLWGEYLLVIGIAACLLSEGVAIQDAAEFDRKEIDIRKTKCEVCKTAVKILFKEVESTDPAKVIEVGSFRLQADGSTRQKKVPYRGSEIQLLSLLDDGKVCGGMKDYVPVTDKRSGLPTMINMVEDMDKIHQVKFNPNPEFNSKMNTFCEEIMGDHEDALMTLFKRHIHADGLKTTAHDFGQQFCIHTTGLCNADDEMETLKAKNAPTDWDFQEDENEELHVDTGDGQFGDIETPYVDRTQQLNEYKDDYKQDKNDEF